MKKTLYVTAEMMLATFPSFGSCYNTKEFPGVSTTTNAPLDITTCPNTICETSSYEVGQDGYVLS